MDNKKVRAWIYYDWANSAFAMTMMAAVLPIFYVDTVAVTLGDPELALSYWGFTQTIAMLIAALIAPILGAYADYSGSKMRFLRFFSLLGIVASGMFAWVGPCNSFLHPCLFGGARPRRQSSDCPLDFQSNGFCRTVSRILWLP